MSESNVKLEDMTFKQSFLIGISQAIAAAFPGVSRSGICNCCKGKIKTAGGYIWRYANDRNS